MQSIDIELIKLLGASVGSLLGLLVLVVGWIGNRIHARLDEINKTLTSIEKDLRQEVNALNTRVALVEEHGKLFQKHMEVCRK